MTKITNFEQNDSSKFEQNDSSKSNMADKNGRSWLDTSEWEKWDKWNKTGEIPYEVYVPYDKVVVDEISPSITGKIVTTTGPYKIGVSAPYTTGVSIPYTPYTTGAIDPDIELDKTTKICDDYEFINFGALLYAIHGMEARIDEDHREIANLQAEIRNLRGQVIDLLDDKAEREKKEEEAKRESGKYSQKELDALLGGYNSVTYE